MSQSALDKNPPPAAGTEFFPALGSKELRVVSDLLASFREPGVRLGMKLDDERTQAEKLGVSRPTVRRALSRLEKHGVIVRRHGAGTFLQVTPDGRMVERILNQQTPEESESNSGPQAAPADGLLESLGVQTVAFLHDSWQSQTSLTPGSHVGSLLTGLCSAAERSAITVTIGSSRPSSQPVIHSDFSTQVYAPDADAIVISATIRSADLPKLARIRVPYVVVTQDTRFGVPNAVMPDMFEGLRQAAERLASSGHRHLAILEVHQRDERSRFAAIADYVRSALEIDSIVHIYSDDPLDSVEQKQIEATGLIVPDAGYLARSLLDKSRVKTLQDGRIDICTFGTSGVALGLPAWIGRLDFDASELGRHAIEALRYMIQTGARSFPTIRVAAMVCE